MHIQVLGPVRVHDSAGRTIEIRSPQLRRVIALLALEGPQAVPSARIRRLMSGSGAPMDSSALATCMYRVRKHIPNGRVIRQNDGYRLALLPGDVLDLNESRACAAAAEQAIARNDTATAISLLSRAASMWHDSGPADPAPDLPKGMTAARRLLKEERRALYERLVRMRLDSKAHRDGLVLTIRECLCSDPLNERLWEWLAISLHQQGRTLDAIEAINEAEDLIGRSVHAQLPHPLSQLRSALQHARTPVLTGHQLRERAS